MAENEYKGYGSEHDKDLAKRKSSAYKEDRVRAAEASKKDFHDYLENMGKISEAKKSIKEKPLRYTDPYHSLKRGLKKQDIHNLEKEQKRLHGSFSTDRENNKLDILTLKEEEKRSEHKAMGGHIKALRVSLDKHFKGK